MVSICFIISFLFHFFSFFWAITNLFLIFFSAKANSFAFCSNNICYRIDCSCNSICCFLNFYLLLISVSICLTDRFGLMRSRYFCFELFDFSLAVLFLLTSRGKLDTTDGLWRELEGLKKSRNSLYSYEFFEGCYYLPASGRAGLKTAYSVIYLFILRYGINFCYPQRSSSSYRYS